MAIIACPDCGKQVSTEALACPHCGRPQKPAPAPVVAAAPPEREGLFLRSLNTGCAVLLFIGGFIAIGVIGLIVLDAVR